jgi:hypothetical protein
MRQPDEALKYLRIVLGEIGRFYEALDVQLNKLLSTTAHKDLPEELRTMMLQRLTELESNVVQIKLSETRGSCRLIKNLYDNFLGPWFLRITDLKAEERKDIAELFHKLEKYDGDILKSMDEMATWIGESAEKARKSLAGGDYDELSRVIENAHEQVKELRSRSVDTIKQLHELQQAFMIKTKAI